jgi:CheY-like chemotaxis protein
MQQHKAGQSARVAVINDDTAFLNLMRDLLETEGGYEAVICREWDDAHAFVKDQRPALVILDIRIGGEEHGWTVLNLLTLDPETRRIPVIVCSAAIQ